MFGLKIDDIDYWVDMFTMDMDLGMDDKHEEEFTRKAIEIEKSSLLNKEKVIKLLKLAVEYIEKYSS